MLKLKCKHFNLYRTVDGNLQSKKIKVYYKTHRQKNREIKRKTLLYQRGEL
jgi:hypothetical protein